jgi:iron-sulfur cluster repair protein YtfE (RIC family)
MDPTKMLEADHRHVEELFDAIDEAEGDDRTPLIDELATALRAHMALEEEVVYPAMRPVVGEETVTEGNTEHELARKALEQMVDLAPDEPGFGAALDATKAGIAHHVDEEEHEVFPKLRQDGKVLDEMATPFMTKRLEFGLKVDAEALAASSTKDELLDEARSAGVEGASSMNKDELAEALAGVMAGTSAS